VDVALCRSALWEALALGFRRPTEETIRRLASRAGAGALAAAAEALSGTEDKDGLAGAVLTLGAEPTLADLEASYDRFFGHTARSRISPYETEYGEDSLFMPQHEMSDLAAFFRTFGLALRADAHERPDHVACESEFMLVLARKEAHALETADAAMLEQTRRAARLFLRDHVGRWAPAFGRRLGREGAGGFYGALGNLCTVFVTRECQRAGVPAGPELLRLRSTEDAATPMACGTSCPGGSAC
jgi:DMSO reductase family type II enzyme chaperone